MTYSRTAQATFSVAAWDEKVAGDIEGTSQVSYVMGYKPGEAPVLALEYFEGSIGGQDGSCVFRHIGTHGAADVHAEIDVVEGMGTGGLESLRGSASVDIGGHGDDGFAFVLSYELD